MEEECFEQTYPSITHISAVRNMALPLSAYIWKHCINQLLLVFAHRHSPGEDDMSSLDKDVEKME